MRGTGSSNRARDTPWGYNHDMHANTRDRVRIGLPILSTILAHVPCCGPLILASIGGTSASLGWLSSLEPMRPYLAALAFVQVAALFAWARWGRRPDCCAEHLESARRRRYRIAWFTLALVALANTAGFIAELAVH